MSPSPLDNALAGRAIELEQYLDGPDGGTLGWLARYADGRALWCGELSRADFRRLPPGVRAALRDDLGWFLVEYDTGSPIPIARVLAKLADETAAPEVLRLVLLGRLQDLGERIGDVVTHCVACPGEPPVGRPPPDGWPAR